ncbi:hypothetical protein OPT61_g1939 [Boeremia exigua]|uniref:Uncharacterized protein n=1 Tax=Boeremia exigua TaxID=749465 RepID=A0ACC2INC2_9PLEO|nr:hypothetical protein OPT61_g1939 [Boeremia exigua]
MGFASGGRKRASADEHRRDDGRVSHPFATIAAEDVRSLPMDSNNLVDHQAKHHVLSEQSKPPTVGQRVPQKPRITDNILYSGWERDDSIPLTTVSST